MTHCSERKNTQKIVKHITVLACVSVSVLPMGEYILCNVLPYVGHLQVAVYNAHTGHHNDACVYIPCAWWRQAQQTSWIKIPGWWIIFSLILFVTVYCCSRLLLWVVFLCCCFGWIFDRCSRRTSLFVACRNSRLLALVFPVSGFRVDYLFLEWSLFLMDILK